MNPSGAKTILPNQGVPPQEAAPKLERPPVEADVENVPEQGTAHAQEEERRRVQIQEALRALSISDEFHQLTHQHASDLKQLDPERQLEALATLAFEKGTVFALKVAEKFNDLAILKQFHDYLVRDDVFPHLDIVKNH